MKAALLLSLGLSLSACMQHTYTQKLNTVEDMPDELRVTAPANCPNFREPMEGDGQNHLHTNYGCATVTNYGAMLTNPRDMIKGRGSDADAERSRLFVNGYNSGAPSNGGDSSGGAASGATSAASMSSGE